MSELPWKNQETRVFWSPFHAIVLLLIYWCISQFWEDALCFFGNPSGLIQSGQLTSAQTRRVAHHISVFQGLGFKNWGLECVWTLRFSSDVYMFFLFRSYGLGRKVYKCL